MREEAGRGPGLCVWAGPGGSQVLPPGAPCALTGPDKTGVCPRREPWRLREARAERPGQQLVGLEGLPGGWGPRPPASCLRLWPVRARWGGR